MAQLFDLPARKAALEARRKDGAYSPRRVTNHFLPAWMNNLDQPPLLREARALRALWSAVELPLFPDERIAGSLCFREPAGFHYGGATWVDRAAAEDYCRQQNLTVAQREELWAALDEVDRRRYHAALPRLFDDMENANIAAGAATSTWFGGHMVLDFQGVLRRGLDAWRGDIAQGRAHNDEPAFYDAMDAMLDAVVIFLQRYGARAEQCAALPGYDRERFLAMAEDLRHIAHWPAQTFHQGLQLVWVLHLLNGADSFGRFDWYLNDLYAQDRAAGRLSHDEALDLLYSVWIKIAEANAIQNMTIGGMDDDGRPVYTELTQLCLTATSHCRYKGPNLCLRVTPDMPVNFWQQAADCLATGIGLPALYNDPLYVRSLTGHGVDERAARGYCLAGCSQIMIPGVCNFINDIGMFNVAKVLELTLHGGVDPRTGKAAGLPLGSAAEFATFDALLEAFEGQLAHAIEVEARIHDKDTVYRDDCEGYALRTLFIGDCVGRGRRLYAGGARYNHTELELIGITNAADSLYAIRRAVFEDRRVTMPALMDALEHNFEGQEPLRRYLRGLPKFGNDHAGVDGLRARISQLCYEGFNNRAAVIGGVYVPGEVIFTAHEHCGAAVGATADGRLAGMVLADSAGAQQGLDRHGPTALLNSVLRIPTQGYLLTSVVLNLRFLASLFAQWEVRAKFVALMDAFFRQGGMQVQVNVCDAAALRQALEDPESWRSLVVRVGGYSDYYVNLPRALQLEILERTEYGGND